MTLGVHQVDGRIAANAAIKIRAALRKSVDARKVIADYLLTHPVKSDNPTQDRARARAWAQHNVTLDLTAFKSALRQHYAEMYVTGVLSAYEAFGKAQRANKAAKNPPHNWADAFAIQALSNAVNWDTWTPGNAAAAALLKPPGALEKLLNGIQIKSIDIANTSYDLLGTKLADGIGAGLVSTQLANSIVDSLSVPSRALTIALTEGSRAATAAAMDSYSALGVEQIKWVAADPTDEICDIDGEIIDIGETFSNGIDPSNSDDMPVHPNCRCSIGTVAPNDVTDAIDSQATD